MLTSLSGPPSVQFILSLFMGLENSFHTHLVCFGMSSGGSLHAESTAKELRALMCRLSKQEVGAASPSVERCSNWLGEVASEKQGLQTWYDRNRHTEMCYLLQPALGRELEYILQPDVSSLCEGTGISDQHDLKQSASECVPLSDNRVTTVFLALKPDFKHPVL